jgi:microcompartment protein CcmL/EutN
MNDRAMGMIELTSVASGFQVADAMMKAANVKLYLSRTICSGKYMVLIGGQVGAVESSVHAGISIASNSMVDSFVIPNIHEDVFRAIARSDVPEIGGALGILESFGVASLIEGADAAAKAANVTLIEVRLAMALGGKAFATMTGDVAAVQAAVDAGQAKIAEAGLLVNAVVIPRPHDDVYTEIV